MDTDIEVRTIETEIKVEQREDAKPVISGYAIVFNKLSEDLGGFREQVAPGACTRAIKEDDIRAAFNHNPNYILGRNKSGTLQLAEDNKGIRFTIDPLPDTQWCRDLQVSIGRGDINQCSFKFSTIKDAWDNSTKNVVRTLQDIRLFDVSIVTYPAYPQTSVKVRDYINALAEPDCQGSPAEGVDGLEILKRRQDFLKLTK
jgi:HK97 family phage prohead protease